MSCTDTVGRMDVDSGLAGKQCIRESSYGHDNSRSDRIE